MGSASQNFDRRLFNLKLRELSQEMQIKSVASDKDASVASRKDGGSYLVRVVAGQLALLREWLQGIDRLCRETWRIQGEAVTPDFVRNVLVPEAMTLIGVRDGVIKTSVECAHLRRRLENPYPAQRHLAREITRLKGEVANRYEVEARELEYQKTPAAQKSGRESQLDELGSIRGLIEDATKDTTLWLQADPSAEERAHVFAIRERLTALARIIERHIERRREAKDDWLWSETVDAVKSRLEKAREARSTIVGKDLARFADRIPRELPGPRPHLVSKAPPPITPVRGLGLAPSRPKPTQVPDLPPHYPNDLKSQTKLILVEAARKLPDLTQTPELCKYIFSELTPHVREAVQRGKLRADLAHSDMEALLHSVLTHNDPGPHNCLGGLSNEAYRFEQEEKKSDEWLGLAKAIESARLEREEAVDGAADHLRTDGKQAESSRAQNSAKATPNVESKSNAATSPFTHSEDYRSVTVRGETYTLTPEQAQMIEILDEAHKNGNPDISSDRIMDRLGKGSSRWQDTFRSTPKAKEALIKSTRKGTLRLNV